MTRPSSLLRNVLSNWLVLALSIAYAFVITPIAVRALGIERYGIWSFLNGLLAYSELLYLGLGSAVIKHVAQYRARNDVAGINRLASVVASIYTVLGLISLATLIGISRFVPGMFAEPLSPDSANAAVITCMLLGLRMLMVFLTSAFAGLLSGYDRYDLVNAVNLFNVALRFAATPVLLQVGWNPLLVLAWLSVAAGVIDFIALTIVGFWTVDGLAVRPARPRAEELRSLYGFGLQSFFIVFAVKLISYTDTTVIGVILGAASVALYSLPLQMVEFARMFVGGFTAVMLPRVTISSTQGDQQAIRDAYLRSARIGFFFAGWLGGGLITLGPMFLSLWIGPSVGDVSPSVLLFLVLALMGQVLSSQVPLAFYQGLGLLALPAIVIAAEGVLNLALSIWLAPTLGLPGVALATAVAAIVSVAVLPAYLCRKLQIPIRLLFDSIAPGAAMIVALLAIQTAVAFALPSVSWFALILRISITAPVAVAIITSMFPDEERRAILRLVNWPKSRQTDTRPPTYSALRRIKQAGIARAPDSLLGAVLLVLERFRPEITSRSPLVMCCVTPGGGAVTIPAPYVLEIFSGPTAPAGWIDTLRSAGIRVTDSTWRSTFAGHAAASAAVLTDAAGSAIGTAGTTPLSAADGVALLTWVGIHAEHQGRGLAKPLVTAALHAAAANGMKTVFLLTDDHRLPAIRTYLATGFRPCPHSWDWLQRPRWRRIARQLGMTFEACDRDAHTQWAGKVPD